MAALPTSWPEPTETASKVDWQDPLHLICPQKSSLRKYVNKMHTTLPTRAAVTTWVRGFQP